MASPEYHQTAEDHSSLLILVKQVSPDHQLSVRSFDKIYERISRITEVKIGDAQGLGLERIIRIRYKKNDYSEECNDWGDFQYHRKLLGLISIGKVLHNRDEDMDEITGNHESAVETYASTLLDSRCFVFLGSGSASSTEEQPASNQNNHVYDRTSVGRMNSRSSVSSFHDPETPTKSGVQFPPSLLTPSHLAQEEVVDEEDKVKEKDESDREIDVDSGNQRNADSRDEGRTQCLDEDSGNHSIDPIVIQDDEAGNGGITAAAAAAQVEKLDHPVAPRPPAAPAEDSDSTPADDDETNDEEEENDGRCEKKGVNARSFVNKANGANENGVTKSSLSSSSSPSPAVTSDVMLPSERIAVVNQADPLSLPKHKNIQSIMYQSACGGITNEVSEASLSSIEGRLEEDIRDLISSLFWVLESKRLDRSHEKVSSSKINLLMAPFEGKTLVGVDTKKRALGRVKKQLGDLSLMAGSPSEALIQYGTAIDILRGTGDFLWMAAALEGQCVASLSLLYPTNGRRDISLQRNASLPPQKVSEINRVTSRSQSQQDHKSRSSVARSPSTASSHSPSPVNSNSNNSSPTNSSKRRLKGTFSLNARSSSSSGSSNSHHKDKSSDMVKALSKIALQSPLDFSEKYKEACCHYAKFRNAAVIEMECSFKAARVMTFLDQHMNAAEFIQNAVFISLNQSNDEQIERLNVISNLYTDIGFHRKAAFYKRFAALKAVSLQLQQPNWSQCYNLLISSMEGYNLTLDPCEYERRIRERDSSSGWTGIHVQLLQELVTTAKRMNATPVAIRHLSFLLQVLSSSLTSSQKKEFASQLESLSRVCGEGAPVPLNLDSGFVIPSVNLTKFPYITSFLCKNLPPHLRPFKLKSKLELDAPKLTPNSPFIFTPLNLTRPITPRRSSIGSAASQTLDFKWVQHETGSVLVQVYNQLPMELTVDHMKLVTNGLPFEVMPISVSFGPDSGPTPITLTGTPKSAGKLELNGYSTHVLGVKSNCLLKDLPHGRKMRVPHQFVIDVVPALPLLSISCPDLDKSTAASFFSNEIDYISANYALQIFAGESRSVNIFLSNSSSHSDQMIEKINLKMISRLKKFEEKQFISLNCDALTQDENIPLAPGSSFEFAIDFYGFSDFVHEDKNRLTVPGASTQGRRKSGTSTPMQQSSQQIFLGSNSGISSPSGIRNKQNNNNNNNNNLQIGTALSNFLSKLQSGTASPKIAKDKRGAGDPDRPDSSLEIYPSKEFDVVIEFEYSGGAGLSAGYCRKSAISFTVEILPSVVITQWHVLLAEMPNRCYLVVDVLNAASEEMELKYSAGKSILIESKETCRVPIEIERCSLKDQDTGTALSAAALSAKCKSHLIQQVNLEYAISTSCKEITGRASIDAIPWTQVMLETILMSPVEWQVSVNGNILPADKPEINCSVGETVSFSISLHDHSDHPIMYLSLWIEMYQEMSNGIKNYDVDSKIMLEGKDKIYVEEIKAGASISHDVGYIFLSSGTYRMEIQSSGYDGNLVSHDLLTTGANNLRAQEQAMSSCRSDYPHHHQAGGSGGSDYSGGFSDQPGCKTSPSLWKLVPTIAINVF